MTTTNQPPFSVGQPVRFNGRSDGTIVEVHTGDLAGMVTVRGERGEVCLDTSAVEPAEPHYTAGTAVRYGSWAGPCLPATVIRRNRTTYTLDFYGSKRRIRHASVHALPCPSCTDHPKTSYPNGYMD